MEEGHLRVMMLTPSLKGIATTSTRGSLVTWLLNSLMASASSQLTYPGAYVLPCRGSGATGEADAVGVNQ